MMRLYFIILTLVIACFANANSDSRVSIHTVNGFKVVLFDTKKGSELMAAHAVPFGMFHDPSHVAGRAHFLEHYMFKGSIRHPGSNDLAQKIQDLGGSGNAFTSDSQTVYFNIVPEQHFRTGIDYTYAPLEGLAWNQAELDKEREVVINEIVNEYMPRDNNAAYVLPFMHLLPEGHRMRAQIFGGTLTNLRETDLRHMQEAFFTNYTPEHVTVIVAANFSKGNVTREQVLDALSSSLKDNSTQKDALNFVATEPPLSSIITPPLRTPEQKENLLEIGSYGDERMLNIYFDNDRALTPRENLVFNFLSSYLTLNIPGSLNDYLQVQKNWITGFGFHYVPLQNRSLHLAQFYLTEEGAKHRSEVVEALYQALYNLKTEGINKAIQATIANYKQVEIEKIDEYLDAGTLYELVKTKDSEQLELRIRNQLMSVTLEECMNLIDYIFQPKKFLMGYLGKEIQSSIKDPDFQRPVRKVITTDLERRAEIALSTKIDSIGKHVSLKDITMPKINFSKRQSPLQLASKPIERVETRRDIRTALEEDHTSTQGYIDAVVKFPAGNTISQAALELWASAFSLRHRSSLIVMASQGLLFSMHPKDNTLKISAEGNSTSCIEAMDWFVTEWKKFIPTRSEFETVRTNNILGTQGAITNTFSARLAMEALTADIANGKFLAEANIKALREIDYDTAQSIVTSATKRADIESVFIGDFSVRDAHKANAILEGLRTKRLTPQERKLLSNKNFKITKSRQVWRPLHPSGNPNAYGLVRAYAGPMLSQDREVLALLVAAQVLQTRIFDLNRSEKKLGYVHGASFRIIGQGRTAIVLVGQTEGRDNFFEIKRGWDEVLLTAKNRTIVNDDFRTDIESIIDSLKILPPGLSDRAGIYMSNLAFRNDPTFRAKAIEILGTLTAAEIYEALDKYVLNEGLPYIEAVSSKEPPPPITSSNGCVDLLTPKK